MAEKVSAEEATTAAVDLPETLEEEMDKYTQDTAKDSAGFSREEEVVAAESAALVAEEVLAWVAVESAVLAWVVA